MTTQVGNVAILLRKGRKAVCRLDVSKEFERDLLDLLRKHGYGLDIELLLPSAGRALRGIRPGNIQRLVAAMLVLSQCRPHDSSVTYEDVEEVCRRARVRIPEGHHLRVTATLARRRGLLQPANKEQRGRIALTPKGREAGRRVLNTNPALARRLAEGPRGGPGIRVP